MKNILTDILLESELNSSEITLYDIDSSRLKTSQIVADKIASSLKVSASIKSTNDRKKALKEADFVIVMIQVGGYKPSTLIDFEIPAKKCNFLSALTTSLLNKSFIEIGIRL